MIRDKGPQQYIFDELKQMGKINFDFADKKDGLGTCIRLAQKLQMFNKDEDLPEILKHQYIVEEFDSARI
jgi:hypothetical protein